MSRMRVLAAAMARCMRPAPWVMLPASTTCRKSLRSVRSKRIATVDAFGFREVKLRRLPVVFKQKTSLGSRPVRFTRCPTVAGGRNMSEDRSEPARISLAYLRFAEVEARGRSSLCETLARGVAADPEIIAFLAALPKEKRQPNLLLAAVRHC